MTNLVKTILATTLFLTSCVSANHLPQNLSDYAKTSAMITLENKRSGGSGVIIRSTPLASYVLTNKHVCQLIQVGGTVTTDEGSFPVHSFRVYKRHDLCLVMVLGDLHQNNKVADQIPSIYSEVTIAGHPALLPTMVTKGHFANHMSIQLIVDSEKCTGEEDNEQEAFFCSMMGVKPVIRTFEAQPVTATIMAGSSGSGVFNERGEVAGLVFAGSEGLSYGFIVPLEYVKDFLGHIKQYPEQFSSPKSEQHFFATFFEMQNLCDSHPKDCKGLAFQGIYHD